MGQGLVSRRVRNFFCALGRKRLPLTPGATPHNLRMWVSCVVQVFPLSFVVVLQPHSAAKAYGFFIAVVFFLTLSRNLSYKLFSHFPEVNCMYAIIETGGKQYRVEEGTKLQVASIEAEVGNAVTIEKVLMLGGGSLSVGAPYVSGAKVTAEVLEHGRGEKIRVFKKWRRNDSRRMQGHRQNYTTIKVTSITA